MNHAITLSVGIVRSPALVYDFLVDPMNWPQWASGLANGMRQENGIWYAAAPSGELPVRFSPRNDLGVLDHVVSPPGAAEVYVPMRVIANDEGTEVLLTLFRQPGMSEADYARDQNWVRHDLDALKALLER